uniref:hypothetical protein n=1 Tax=Amycolatopsis sp. CA-096443 TaxID=3239919 RepID=UPI003F495DEE
MSSMALVVPCPVQRDVGEVLSAAEVAEIYVRLLDDLTRAVEQSPERCTLPGKVAIDKLGGLVAALDELTLSMPEVAPAALAGRVEELRAYVMGCTFRSEALRKLFAPFDELHDMLTRLASAAPTANGAR